MRQVSIAAFIFALLAAAPDLADGQDLGSVGGATISSGEVAATPDMWFYEQYRREHLDPKLAVRRKAEFRAAQRQSRIAAMRWFGFSNQRPQCSSDPWHGDWSSVWRSNNGTHPLQWNGVGRPWIVVNSP